MSEIFMEIIVNAEEAFAVGIESRDDIEDPVEEALSSTGFGEVTGGGGGMGTYTIDVEVVDDQFDDALQALRDVLQSLKVPKSTIIKRYKPEEIEFPVYND